VWNSGRENHLGQRSYADRIQQAGHMDASDPIQQNRSPILQAGGRPHMDCFVVSLLAMTTQVDETEVSAGSAAAPQSRRR
jgi:hypothetical protein